MWKVNSPNHVIQIKVWQNEEKGLRYSVYCNDQLVIEKSMLGIRTDIADFTDGFHFEKQKVTKIDDDYSIPAHKKAVYTNQANELALYFSWQDYPFVVRMRAYDDGIGFRYEIPHQESESLLVLGETTDFNFPKGYDELWLQNWVCHYEAPYNHSGWGDTNNRDYGMPSLFHNDNSEKWVMITEANVYNTNGNYCSCHLRGGKERNMRIDFAPEEEGQPIKCRLPFSSPWRVIVIVETLSELVNTTLNYNLNPPMKMKDLSFIKPGRCLWAWWEFENGAQLFTEQKRYVDFAAAMGFEGLTVDADWDLTWLLQLCEYAHAKNLVVWLWSAMQYIDTPEKAEAKIPLWAKCGVDGLKVDFFQNDSQHTMWQYEMIAEMMTKYQLMINFHGATKCMGEGRTWPNFMTAEGIMGLEHHKWSDMPNAKHNCTVPFTRNVIGPMDYTPTGFSNKNRNTTLAHQMVLPLVFESGATHIAASIYYLEAWKGTEFLRRMKPVYDGVSVLSGFPGHHAAILRWVEDEWLIGCITDKAMTMRLPLDFLPDGQSFEADIYEDDSSGEMLAVKRCEVRRGDVIELPLQDSGGAGIYITPKIKALPSGISSDYMSTKRSEYAALQGQVCGGSEIAEYENGLKTVLLNGKLIISVSATRRATHTMRVFYAATASFEIMVKVGENNVIQTLPASGSNKIFIVADINVPLGAGENSLELSYLKGAIPSIEKVAIIDNSPKSKLFVPVTKAWCKGGAELVKTKDKVIKAVGIGLGGELIFNNVVLSEDTYYIIRFEYCAGESRDLYIEINDSEVYKTNLHSTSGWGFPVWDVREGTEVRIKMKKGGNKIRLFNEEGRAAHLFGLVFIEDDFNYQSPVFE